MDYRDGHAKALDKTGKTVTVYLDSRLSKIADSPIKSLDRNTAYKIGDAVSVNSLPKPGYLICNVAGTTAVSVNTDYKTATEGSILNDGTASFRVKFLDQSMSKADLVIAGKVEAETGADNIKLMTPLRVKEAISAQTADIEGIAIGDVVYRPYLRQGYVKANGATVNRSDYPRLVDFANQNNLWTNSPNTEPWKFGRGNGSTTMVLPNYIGRFIQGGDIPKLILAALPNIKGSYDSTIPQALPNFVWKKENGALSFDNPETTIVGDADSSPRSKYMHTIIFDASLSNPVYGSSDTVQPPSISLIAQIKY